MEGPPKIKSPPGYLPGEPIGGGGQARVFKIARAEQPGGPLFACKVSISSRELDLPRVRSEIQVLSLLKARSPAATGPGGGPGPHWPLLRDQGRDEAGRLWLVYDWVEGQNLHDLVRTQTLTLEDRLHIAVACCDALNAWHALGFIHRDIKPANIVLRRAGGGWHATIIDAGLAQIPTDQQDNAAGVSAASSLMGTTYFRHRELLELGSACATFRDDVYALCASFYQLFSGLPLVMDEDLAHIRDERGEQQQCLKRERAFWNLPEHPSMRGRLGRCLSTAALTEARPRLAALAIEHDAQVRRLKGPLGEALDLILLRGTYETYGWIYRSVARLGEDLRRVDKWMRAGGDIGASTLPDLLALRDAPWSKPHEPAPAGWWRDARLWRHSEHAAMMQRHQSLCRGADGLIRLNDVAAAKGVLESIDPELMEAWEVKHLRLRADGALVVLRGHDGWVRSAAFSPDETRVVTVSSDGTARVFDAAGGGEPVVLRGHDKAVLSASFSPDGTRVVTVSDDGTARVFDAAGGGEPVVLRGHDGAVISASFSPDGTRVVTASNDGTARVFDAAGGREPVVLRGHGGPVNSASFSPDGTRVVTASVDGTARVFDAAGGAELAALRGHDGWVRSAAFSPDGTRVVTASGDDTARVFDAAGGAELTALRGHGNWVRSASFSPDGTRVVTASGDATARVWHSQLRPLRARGGGGPKATVATPPRAEDPDPIGAYAHTWVMGLRAQGLGDEAILDRAEDDPAHTPDHLRAIGEYLKRYPAPPKPG